MAQVPEHVEKQLLDLLREFLEEMGAERALKRVSLTADFEADLGIDSLGRIEFIHRVEEAVSCKLSTSVFGEAQNLNDLIKFVSSCVPYEDLAKMRLPESEMGDISPSLPKGRTLVDSLLTQVKHTPNKVHIYLMQEDGSESTITYQMLYDKAMALAGGLIARGLKPDETVAIMLPTSEDFFVSFMGILLSGGIPVPIYPPMRPSRLEEYVLREANLLRNAGARFLITFPQAQTLSYLIQGLIPSMHEVITVAKLSASHEPFTPPVILPTDPAFIQYTSGSTGNPKGVLLTHANILANLNAAAEVINVTPQDRIVSWLPLYHDMGLIGCWFGSLYYSVPLSIMSPLTFISRPETWLWAIHTHKGTLTAAPNFAYELCIRRIKDKDIQGLDLSSLRLVLNGAEAIHPETLRRFIERFEPYGFKPSAMYPVYGLAESTVALAFPPISRQQPRIDVIKRDELENNKIAVTADPEDKHASEFVGCGSAIPGHQIKIVDKDGVDLPERTVGRLLFKGPSCMEGYYNNPTATAAIKHDGWIDSGDFAYIAEGDVFITGRTKDVIIKAGKNIYPDDIEDITGKVPGIRSGRVIAFGVEDKSKGTERLIIVAETMEKDKEARDHIVAEVTSKLVIELGLPPDEVVLARPGTIPKTSSGKLQRSACKAEYVSNRLQHKTVPVWMQMGKITTRSYLERMKKILSKVGHLVFTIYAALLAIPIVVLGLISIALTPQKIAQHLAKFWLRLFFALSGMAIKITDKQYLTKKLPTVYVANHSSYIDALIMAAVLPAGSAAVGKKELVSFKPFKWLWNKLGHMTVERQDITQGLSDLVLMEEALRTGTSLLIFPEGTFTHVPGLRQFKTGAFKLAVDTGVPICPVAIEGAREILPDGSFLLKPRSINITVYPPLFPESTEWSEVLRLSAMAREEIAKGCGEAVFESR